MPESSGSRASIKEVEVRGSDPVVENPVAGSDLI